MRFGSLFAGAGGFDLGFEAAGLTCAFQVEIDKTANEVLANRWPDVPKFTDVREVGSSNLPGCDVLVGGFPCQDLSVAGKRGGLEGGTRSGLFYELARIACELRPRFVVWENVPGLLSSDNGRDFARVLRHLGDCGFHGGWRVLDARFFGVAQRRRRVFGVFARGRSGAESCAEILALREGVRGHSAAGGKAGEGVAGRLAQCLRASGVGTERAGDGTPLTTYAIQERAVSENLDNGPGGKGYQPDIAYTLEARHHVQASASAFGVRRLTPRECERLQGWPDDHTRYRADGSEIADGPRYRMIGNGVASPCAHWLARRLLQYGVFRD